MFRANLETKEDGTAICPVSIQDGLSQQAENDGMVSGD